MVFLILVCKFQKKFVPRWLQCQVKESECGRRQNKNSIEPKIAVFSVCPKKNNKFHFRIKSKYLSDGTQVDLIDVEVSPF